jgi:polysaccharide export outer membrane protein
MLESWSRARAIVCGVLSLLAVLSLPAAADTDAPKPEAPPAAQVGPSDAPASTSVGDVDVLAPQAPGREAIESLHRNLVTPSAESRWNGLQVFGHDLFAGSPERFSVVEGAPVGPDYVLGPGDNVIVFVSGLRDTSFSLTLDREGKVFLPRVGTTYLWGLGFADAENLIKDRLASVLRNARVQVSMGRVRTLEVLVAGAVAHPGTYSLTGMATAFHALAAAGGPDPLGSLRSIRVLRASQMVSRLDLYPFLLEGDRGGDVRLQAGDVVFVDLLKTQVGIRGAVVRPGVYESAGPMTLRSLLQMSGGATPFADLSRIRVERVDANGGFRLQDLPLDHGHGIDPDSLMLSDYDLVTVLPLNERVRNVVTLDGYVRHPGEYELTEGMRLSQLVAADRVLPEADLDHAELRRIDPTTFRVRVETFAPRAIWSGTGDRTLQPLDAVTLFSAARIPRALMLEGEVTRPGTYSAEPGERLSHVLARAGGVTPQGWLPAAVFVRRTAAHQERRSIREFVKRQRVEMAREESSAAGSADSTGANAAVAAQERLLLAIEEQSDPGRVVLDLDANGRWAGTDRDPMIEDGDRLIVPLRPAAVTVLGNVMNPGTIMARHNASFADYVRLAGGTSRQADLGRSYVLKANGVALPRAHASRVEPGDAIVVPPRDASGRGLAHAFDSGWRFVSELAATVALVVAVRR